ncbi:MAG: Ig-like domain-containing protein [Clostridia bacterium]|nr:Ig-like domain-containing protein [Clostridia bacterium]
MKKIDKITAIVLAVLFAAVTGANLFQPNRPTESALEQRTLAKIPAFSLTALTDGSYFSGLSSFFSDTFLGRDKLVDAAKEMDTLMGIPYDMGGEEQFALLQTGSQTQTGPDASDEEALAEAFDKLMNRTETETTADPDVPETEPAETEADETEPPETEPAETEPAETEPAETEPEETKPAETEPDETKPAETEPQETKSSQTVNAVTLSRETVRLTIGSGSVVYATVDTSDGKGASVSWSISDKNIATIAKNPGGGIDVKGVAEGECTLYCRSGDQAKAECKIIVSKVTSVTQNVDNATADFLTNGMFIYGDGVYTPAYYSESSAKYYAQTMAYYKSLFGKDVRVNVIMTPVSSMVIDNPSVQARISDQGEIQDKVAALMDKSVNFVDVYSEMYAHRDEYLFFKSDHHWTQLGAYYAYRAFAESLDMVPTELKDLNYSVINDSYSGSMYTFTKDSRVKNFKDTIESWTTKKKMTMTVTTSYGGINTYDSCITPYGNNYVSFIAGDNPYTVINVPENPQDKNILVLKDSFGNAFVPYLCEHYGNIIVVDVRYTDMNVYEHLKDYGLTDIVFVNNVQAALSTTWSKMYLKAVGVE